MHAGSCCSLPRACKPIPKPLPPLPPLLLHIQDGFSFCSLSRARRDHHHRKKQSILPSASESNKSRKTSTATTTPWPCSNSKLAEMQLPENSTIEIAAGKKNTESLCKIQSQHPRSKQASKKAIILLCVETKNRGRELVVAAARDVGRRRRVQSANLVEGKARSRSKIREIGWRALSSVWRHFHHFRFSLFFYLFFLVPFHFWMNL